MISMVEGTSSRAVTLKIPYEVEEDRGKVLDLVVDDRNLAGIFVPDEPPLLRDLIGELARVVENPVCGKKLSEILAKGQKVAIITENQFRQAPTPALIPWLLARIREAGATPVIVIGNARLRPLSAEQIEEKLGSEVVRSGVEIFCNDINKPEQFVYKGITSSGVPLWIHYKAAEADVVITLATTQATLWGYGGSGMIIPGVSGRDTIEYNHFMALAPDCVPGNNECKIQADKYDAARMIGVALGINVIVNNLGDTTYINAGDFVEAHQEAVRGSMIGCTGSTLLSSNIRRRISLSLVRPLLRTIFFITPAGRFLTACRS
jgi:nickel-dependent lactate racemase